MNLTIKDFMKGKIDNVEDLVNLSDMIWEIGELEEIKAKINPELFTLHIMINMIGNWQGDGWLGILHYQDKLIPYIPHALSELEFHEIKNSFQEIISIYPNISSFSKEERFFRDKLDVLEDLSDLIWGCNAPSGGWGCVFDYLKKVDRQIL